MSLEQQEPIRPGLYRHFKGNNYEVIGEVTHSETEEQLVLYRALYGERGLWVRPKTLFCETVIVNGQQTPRFAFVSSNLK
jgi:hypothetical protein